jgi:hypothetical protein
MILVEERKTESGREHVVVESESEREREREFGVYVQGRYILGGNILMVGLENDLQMLSSTM